MFLLIFNEYLYINIFIPHIRMQPSSYMSVERLIRDNIYSELQYSTLHAWVCCSTVCTTHCCVCYEASLHVVQSPSSNVLPLLCHYQASVSSYSDPCVPSRVCVCVHVCACVFALYCLYTTAVAAAVADSFQSLERCLALSLTI